METRYGFPIVSVDNVFPLLKDAGIVSWARAGEPTDLEAYRSSNLSDVQRDELRFAPHNKVVPFVRPDGKPFTGFLRIWPSGVIIFTLLKDDLLVIVGEWKHGVETVTLSLPTGAIEQDERDDPSRAAHREFKEECGITLDRLVPLGNHEGIPVAARQATARMYSYLGIVHEPIALSPQRLDEAERLQIMLIPLAEWLTLIERGAMIEGFAIITTFLALQKLERLSSV